MGKEQKGFIVYGDIKATSDELSDEQLGKLFRGMIDYFVQGECPRFTDSLKFAFIPIKQQMDRDADKYVKRCEKMRENVNKRWGKDTKVYNGIQLNTNDTNTNTNTNTNKDKDTNTESAEIDGNALSLFLTDYLNKKAGTGYVVGSADVIRIRSLLEAGYTQDQMRTVIDKKCAEWLGDEKMRPYLRPSTLFGDKFAEYLNAPISLAAERKRETNRKMSELNRELDEKRRTLDDLRDSLQNADKTERRQLREQIAILEDSIGLIEKRIGGAA